MATFRFLNENKIDEHPFLIDDYFKLCTRTMTKLPERFLTNVETTNGIVNLAIMTIYLQQKEANETINKFFGKFLQLPHPLVGTQYMATDYGRNIIYSLIDSMIFKLPGYFIPDQVEPLWLFKEKYPEVRFSLLLSLFLKK